MDILSTLSAAMLIFAGGYFTIKTRAFYLRHPIKTMRMLPLESGVKQMLLSLGGTGGVGNISGVAVALMIGGAGAVLWMWVGAFFAMALKYAEITLGMLDRRGAQFYIRKALGSVASILFLILLVMDCIMMGGMIQASAISEAVHTALGISPFVCGIFICLLAAFVFLFKLDLFRLSTYVVPLMSIGYTVLAISIIVCYAERLLEVIKGIFISSFDFESVSGGMIGFLFTPAFKQGIVKGLFSNEAGCGTAPTAHAASKERVPARQGLFGILEVFIDTVVMCTLTAFAILLTLGDDVSKIGGGGVAVCIRAFACLFGDASAPVICLFVFLFAFSAIVSFGYYGSQNVTALFGTDKAQSLFLVAYCFSVLLGATIAPMAIWTFADAVVCLMLIINTTAVLVLRKNIECDYTQIGKYSQRDSKTCSFSSERIKNAIPMSDTDIKRGFM